MELTDFGAILLLINAVSHFIGFRGLQRAGGSSTQIVAFAAFVGINAALGVLVLAGLDWSEWLAIVFPAIGGLSLGATLRDFAAPRWLAYTILGLDIALVIVFSVARL